MAVKRESRKFQNDQMFSNSMMSVDVRCKVGQRVDLLENKSVYFAVECDIITYKVFKAANSYFNEVFNAANNYSLFFFFRNKGWCVAEKVRCNLR